MALLLYRVGASTGNDQPAIAGKTQCRSLDGESDSSRSTSNLSRRFDPFRWIECWLAALFPPSASPRSKGTTSNSGAESKKIPQNLGRSCKFFERGDSTPRNGTLTRGWVVSLCTSVRFRRAAEQDKTALPYGTRPGTVQVTSRRSSRRHSSETVPAGPRPGPTALAAATYRSSWRGGSTRPAAQLRPAGNRCCRTRS